MIRSKIDNILNVLSNLIPHDKLNHMVYGTGIYLLLVILLYIVNIQGAAIIACLITIVLAISKEIYDRFDPQHTADILDFVYTITYPVIITCILIFMK